MSSQLSLFVITFTLINIAACLWLLWWTARSRTPAAAKTANGEPEKTGHVWDDDLEEFNNPLPRWWLWLFIITVVFGVLYLVLYPGLGNFGGTRGWTQVRAYEAQMNVQRAKLEERLASLKDKSLHELTQEAAAMSTAKNLFGQNCSTCHGSDARGAKGFPNLADGDWLWGGADATVYATIAEGRRGVMPAWGEVLGEQGVDEVASYIFSLNQRQAPADWVAAGKQQFAVMCAGCHGADAKGNPLLGAPNLADNVWLYGGDFDTIKETIVTGRENEMPAHLGALGEARVRLLAAYVLSLDDDEVGSGTAPPRAFARVPVVEDAAAPARPAT
ncbi:MAG: cytochrome-c oxidase, cbb3-type subunit III [Steroidobacteraceae bacterium]